jgi:hypothetical protein
MPHLRAIISIIIAFILTPLPILNADAIVSYAFPRPVSKVSSQPLAIVATFTSLSLYWKPETGSDGDMGLVRYRKKGTSVWYQGHPLWFDGRNQPQIPARNGEFRGSIVSLASGTEYEIQVMNAATGELVTGKAKSWSNVFPVAKTVTVGNSTRQTLTIDESGTASGYILYTAAAGTTATLDAENAVDSNIVMNGSYIIIRGLTLKGARRIGILLGADAHHVVIEGNDISGFGRIAADGWGEPNDGGIIHWNSKASVTAFVIQNNKIHHPRSDANNWHEYRAAQQTYHPTGARAIGLWTPGSNNVIRFNDIYSDDNHYFADGIGGGWGASFRGFPGADSDIIGNRVTYAWDDGIESDGGNQNVRIAGNYIDRIYHAISASPVSVGPLYVYRNVSYLTAIDPIESKGSFLKIQTRIQDGVFYGDSGVYVYHNTLYRTASTVGTKVGVQPSGTELLNVVTLNNIFHVADKAIDDPSMNASNSFDYDLYWGYLKTAPYQEPHGTKQFPLYDAAAASGPYTLVSKSPGQDDGAVIPNFSQGYLGSAPDRGAQERDANPLKFGVR